MKNLKARIIVRYTIVATLVLMFSALIVAEVFDTTVRHRAEWEFRTDSLLSIKTKIKPKRGDILACDGSVLATNITYYTVRIDFRSEQFKAEDYAASIDEMSDSLAKHFGKGKDYWVNHLLEPLSKPRYKRTRSFALIKNISYNDYLKIRTFPYLNNPYKNVCGLKLEEEERRSNPYGKMALRSVGTLTEDATKERHGYCGLEKDLDSLLYGKAGVSRIVPVNKNTINWVDTPAINGYTIKTTIDIKMQDIVENELEKELKDCQADWGVAILMEVETGDIKAISNLELNRSQTKYIEGMNRAVRGFEPSSVVKPISMLFALENGWAPNLNRVIETGTVYQYGKGVDPIEDQNGPPSMPIWEIVERSSNIGITKLIMPHIKSPYQLKEFLDKIGFLESMDLHISGTRTPNFPFEADGGLINVSRMLFGYTSEIPPIYTLSFYNAIANDGKYVRPRFVSNIIDNNGNDSVIPVSYIRERIGSEKNVKILQQMLERVVWGNSGTARKFLRNDLVKIAGKTGTCRTIIEPARDEKTGELLDCDMYGRPLPKDGKRYTKERRRLTLCGYFPADNPKYSCIVMMHYPKRDLSPAATCGVVLREVALKMYSRVMLYNESDYKASQTKKSTPTLIATKNSSSYDFVKKGFNINDIKRMSVSSVSSGVPNVTGMGVREAVVILERAGYNVELEGMGYVKEQIPAAGLSASKGERIKLVLSNI